MSTDRKPKNIYVIGAQCTGKTSLVHALEGSFDSSFHVAPPAIIREVARSVLKRHGFTAHDITSDRDRCSNLQSLILEAQYEKEREALMQASWIISDCSGLDPIVYARRHVGPELHVAEAMMSTEKWQELCDRMSKSLVFVCEAGADWLTDDGVRLMPEGMKDWIGCHADFCQLLEKLGLRYEVIPYSMSSIEERASHVWLKWREAMCSK